MGRNFWMVVVSLDDYVTTKSKGFTIHGMKSRYRRRAQRMQPDDRVLFYVSTIKKWTATAIITSNYFEDRSPIWRTSNGRDEFIYRVKLSPGIVLEEEDFIDALLLAPRLDYVRRWAPEDWPLAFLDSLHLLPQKDFRLIESEMKRNLSRRRRRQGLAPAYEPDVSSEDDELDFDEEAEDASQEEALEARYRSPASDVGRNGAVHTNDDEDDDFRQG